MTGHADTIRRISSWCGHGSECWDDPPCDVHALLAERQQVQEALLIAQTAAGEYRSERRQAIDALREIADERTAGGEQTTSGASRAASIARAALVKLGETKP